MVKFQVLRIFFLSENMLQEALESGHTSTIIPLLGLGEFPTVAPAIGFGDADPLGERTAVSPKTDLGAVKQDSSEDTEKLLLGVIG